MSGNTSYRLICAANVHTQYKNGKTILHCAAEKGNEKVIKLLLEHQANVHAEDNDGKTALHSAAGNGNEKVVELLVEHQANVNAQDNNGMTVLHVAVQNRHEKVAKLLLEYGANVDAEDKDGDSILYIAVKARCPVEHILMHCPDVNNKSNKKALNVAVFGCGNEYSKIIANLIQYGFTVNPEDVNNGELLHVAVEKGYLKIVEELLKNGTDVNMLYKNYMPLHVATKNKQEEMATLLISYGADVNAQDKTEKVPLFYATQNTDLNITKLRLINKTNVKDNPELLYFAIKKECIEIVENLLENGANVNTSDKNGRTALHFTVTKNNKHNDIVKGKIAKLLLSRGANVNAQTARGITTLHDAINEEYVKVVKALLEYNADVNSTFKNHVTPLQLSVQKGNAIITKMLLSKGANINAKLKEGTTALHIAAQKDHVQVMEVLLKFDADIDSKDGDGRTALHIASKERNEQIVSALLERGADINILTKNFTPLDFAMAYYFHNNRGISSCGVIIETLKNHIVKMKTANLYVNKKNLSTYDKCNFQNKCEKEIASMISEKIGNSNISFYDILTENIYQLAIILENENIVQIVRSAEYRIKFPIYASMINNQLRKGKKRKGLLKQVTKYCNNIFPQLPYYCTEKIFRYLSDGDLRILIHACQPSNVNSPL